MNAALTYATLLLSLCAVAVPAMAQTKARSEALDIDDKDRALVAKETLKQNRDMKRMGVAGKTPNSQCGTVDIGNDNSNKKGSQQIAAREKTVIVTGPVINTANCK